MLTPKPSISELALMPNFDSALNELLKNNLPFHAILEKETQETRYGTITFNFAIKNGRVVLSTLNIVKNRRLRY
jgi:hypothetical protein